jgi:RNA polymerase sigma-70 factor (ECF subfamily)
MPAYNEPELLQLASQGDERAFQLIFNEYWPKIYGTALRLTRSPEPARDLAQDVFLKLWDNRHKLKDVQRVDAYIYILSRNLIMDFLRKRVFNDHNMDYLLEYSRCDALSAHENLEFKEMETFLHEEIDKLPGKVKDVLRLKYLEGLSHQEIAQRLNISVVSSKTYVVRGLQEIRARFFSLSKNLLVFLVLFFRF